MSTINEQIAPASLHKLALLAEKYGYRSIDEYVEFSLNGANFDDEQNEKPLYETGSPDEWINSLTEWAMSHSTRPDVLNVIDDSRASIYEGRGE